MQRKLIEQYGFWGEHPECPLPVWKYEVANDETRLGYWQWAVKVLVTLNEKKD